MSNYYAKNEQTSKRERYFFYGINRNDTDGFLTLYKVDVNDIDTTIPIQSPSIDPSGDRPFDKFEQGVDFFDGRDVEHNLVYDGLICEQYRWDSKNVFYFIDEEGNLTARINYPYNYSEGVTETYTLGTFFIADLDLGTIVEPNPLENVSLVDLGAVADSEIPAEVIDLGSIT